MMKKKMVWEAKCEKCKWVWITEKAQPVRCPRCRSVRWNDEKEKPKAGELDESVPY